MRRRQFLSGLAASGLVPVTWSPMAFSQQSLPVIGMMHSGVQALFADAAFRKGLADAGYVDRQNVLTEYRFADGDYDRLPLMADELVARKVAVIAALGGVQTALAAKRTTNTIPIIFANGSDPVEFGLVASLGKPGGNVTGVSFFTAELEGKRLGLLREVLPAATVMAGLVNPGSPNAPNQSREFKQAAQAMSLDVRLLNAASESELDETFKALSGASVSALAVAADPFFYTRRERIVALAARYRVPAIYEWRGFCEAGGLMSYGTNMFDAYRQAGFYVGQVLKGAKPDDLPVFRSTKFEFVINLKTARTLGIELPPMLVARADEVIE